MKKKIEPIKIEPIKEPIKEPKPEPIKIQIGELPTDFGREDLNQISGKINEIIRIINK